MMSDQKARETIEKWSRLAKQASSDHSLKRRLMDNPTAVLAEFGMNVRPGLEVRVVENTDKVTYLTLPARPREGDLSNDELDGVVGGLLSPYWQVTFETVFIT